MFNKTNKTNMINLREKIILVLLLFTAFFVRIYKIDTLMIFNGDQGRDYLAAKDMVTGKEIPLVGIPTSIPWLRQGPLFIYLLAPTLWLFNFNPVSGAFLTILLDTLAVFFLYLLVKFWYDGRLGILGSFFYSFSPLVIIQSRLPYHISPIPLATILFFLSLTLAVKKNRKYFLAAFFLVGILLNLELATVPYLLILAIILWQKRQLLNRKILYGGLALFLLTQLPKIIFDLSHNFSQTIGFGLWIIYRIGLFLGLISPISQISPIGRIGSNLGLIMDYFRKLVFWDSRLISGFILLLIIVFLRKQIVRNLLLFLWIGVNLAGILIHSDPPIAYFESLFPIPSILMGMLIGQIRQIGVMISIAAALILAFLNLKILVDYDYMTVSKKTASELHRDTTSQALETRQEVADFIKSTTNGRPFNLIDANPDTRRFESSLDNFKYLLWKQGVLVSSKNEPLKFLIFENKKQYKRLKIKGKFYEFSHSGVFVTE